MLNVLDFGRINCLHTTKLMPEFPKTHIYTYCATTPLMLFRPAFTHPALRIHPKNARFMLYINLHVLCGDFSWP